MEKTDSDKLNEIHLLLTDERVGALMRISKIEKILSGNGQIGLIEKVRNLESNWKAITAGISFLTSVAVAMAHRFFAK